MHNTRTHQHEQQNEIQPSFIILFTPVLCLLWLVQMCSMRDVYWAIILKYTACNIIKIWQYSLSSRRDVTDYIPLCAFSGGTPEESRCLNLPANQSHHLSHAAPCKNGHQHRHPVVKEVELFIVVVILSQYSRVTLNRPQTPCDCMSDLWTQTTWCDCTWDCLWHDTTLDVTTLTKTNSFTSLSLCLMRAKQFQGNTWLWFFAPLLWLQWFSTNHTCLCWCTCSISTWYNRIKLCSCLLSRSSRGSDQIDIDLNFTDNLWWYCDRFTF